MCIRDSILSVEDFGFSGLDFMPLEEGKYLYEPKSACSLSKGHMVYNQAKVYEITPTCIICNQYGIFDRSLQKCICFPGYTM